MIEKAGCATATPVVITSQNEFDIIVDGEVNLNQDIMKLK